MQVIYNHSLFDEFCYYAVMDDSDNFEIVRRRLNGYTCTCRKVDCVHIQAVIDVAHRIKRA